jgi:hypothetical protein
LLILQAMGDPFTCYLDESGHAADPTLDLMAMGGMIGRPDAWRSFSADWSKLLEAEQVSIFHMKDFENYKREFSGWTVERHQRFLAAIVAYLTDLPVYFVGLSIFLRDIAPIRERFGKGSEPYYYLFKLLIGRTAGSIRTIPPEPVVIDIIAAEHPEFSGFLASGYERAKKDIPSADRLGKLSIASPREVSALQAADLVAYETLKYQTSQLVPSKKRPTRWPMLQIGRTKRYLISHAKVNGVREENERPS